MNVLIDLKPDVLDHIENVRKAYFLNSRRAAISHIIRDHMLRSPCDVIVRQMEGFASLETGKIKLPEEWPVAVNKFLCPACDPRLGINRHCLHGDGKLIDMVLPDLDNSKRGAGNEQMIRWICVCPKCNSDYAADPEAIAAAEPLAVPDMRSHRRKTIEDGPIKGGSLEGIFNSLAIFCAGEEARKENMKDVERILRDELGWARDVIDGEVYYSRPMGAK